jgi:hypothetical protein
MISAGEIGILELHEHPGAVRYRTQSEGEMAKNVLFFVHGIGVHKIGWINEPDGPVAALNAAMDLYPACFAGKELSDYLDLVEIRYDDIFDTVLKTWQNLGNSLPANGGFDWTGEVQSLLQSVNGNRETFVRYGGDVLLYCGFDLVARAVRLRVSAIIATKIYQAWLAAGGSPGRVPRFAVVAHSLGTTVAQDALYQLAQAKWDDDLAEVSAKRPALTDNAALSGRDKAAFDSVVAGSRANPDKPIPVGLSALYLVSNTIPLLRQVDGDYALVQSGGTFDCARVYNINHALDPVSRIGGGAANPNPRPGWTNVTVRHIHQRNIHGFGHYLSNPAVHAPIFARLIDPGFAAGCAQSAAALAQAPEWTGFGGTLAGLDQQARQILENQLRGLITGESSVAALRAAIEQFIKQLGD